MTQTTDLAPLIERLCQREGVADQAALMETPTFQAAYLKEHSKAPSLSFGSLSGKAFKSMRNVQETGVDLQAHCIEPRYENIRYEKGEGGKKGKMVLESIGILAVTPDGESKFVKFADFDPLTPAEQQFAAMGAPAGLARGSPITLHKVDTFTDLMEGTTRVTITKESVIEAGGHANPFPEGPDLERVIGATAMEKKQSAWKTVKKYGTLNGRFGDTKGDPRPAVLTITSKKEDINVRNFDDDPPEDHHVAAPSYDRKGNGVGVKYKLADVLEQLGLPHGASREAVIAAVAGQRVLVRGQGSLYMPKSPKDFGEVDGGGLLFDQRIEELKADGYLVGYGEGGNLRLSLVDKYVIDEPTGERQPQISVKIGDRDVYDIVQKKDDADGNATWEISTLAADDNKLPWMSCYGSSGTYERDGEEKEWEYNRNAFVLFLEGSGTGAELRDDDPFKAVAANMPLPSFLAALKAPATPAAPTANGTAAKAPAAPLKAR